MSRSQSERYYDAFADSYEDQRHRGYHRLLDELEVEIVEKHCAGSILEAGCGTGLILHRLRAGGRRVFGIDLSSGMLRRAQQRDLNVLQASVAELPFPADTFDAVASFKVLAHVQPIERSLQELARVTRPGGALVLEFYNRHSLRFAIKQLKQPNTIGEAFTDEDVYTRYDSLPEVEAILPQGVVLEAVYGIRVVTPAAQLHDLPLVGPGLRWLERRLARLPGTRRLGGFLVVVARKTASLSED